MPLYCISPFFFFSIYLSRNLSSCSDIVTAVLCVNGFGGVGGKLLHLFINQKSVCLSVEQASQRGRRAVFSSLLFLHLCSEQSPSSLLLHRISSIPKHQTNKPRHRVPLSPPCKPDSVFRVAVKIVFRWFQRRWHNTRKHTHTHRHTHQLTHPVSYVQRLLCVTKRSVPWRLLVGSPRAE